LRSDTALLQIVGRAARNRNGRAIFYAKHVTESMQRCMDITNRRRQTQLAYNVQHGHEPKSTRGSSVLSFFDLLKDQIEAEQNLEIVPSNNKKKHERALDLPMTRVALDDDSKKRQHIVTDHIPSSPGVYFWKDEEGKTLYIGKAVKLRARIKSYLTPNAKHSKRIKAMVEKAVYPHVEPPREQTSRNLWRNIAD
jgi:hypothetical protein